MAEVARIVSPWRDGIIAAQGTYDDALRAATDALDRTLTQLGVRCGAEADATRNTFYDARARASQTCLATLRDLQDRYERKGAPALWLTV